MNKAAKGIIFLGIVIVTSCSVSRMNNSGETEVRKPESPELYKTIAHLDSVFFNAYNTCNIDIQAAFYSDSIEFYHDQGGMVSSKQEILDATRRNICGKITRELVKGSIEVYPVPGYGAVELGLHRFHNNTEKEKRTSEADKFVIIWQQKNNTWKITRVISLH
jgi:Domain of unknown function (DUF4440)